MHFIAYYARSPHLATLLDSVVISGLFVTVFDGMWDPRAIRAMRVFSIYHRSKFVEVQFLSYSCQRTFLLTFAIAYGG